jgi:hypothetical protein
MTLPKFSKVFGPEHTGRFVVSEGIAPTCLALPEGYLGENKRWWESLTQEQKDYWGDIEKRHRIWWDGGRLGPNPRDEWKEPIIYGRIRVNAPSLGELNE